MSIGKIYFPALTSRDRLYFTMLNSEILARSKDYPPGFSRDYDAHIYFEASQRAQAEDLRQAAARAFSHRPVLVGEMVDYLVGPHPLPMFEINFPKTDYDSLVTWLESRRGKLVALVHEVTGYDHRDHSIGARWLGPALPLDVTKLDPDPILILP
jgi:aromatic ring-cleaving dioxygenase